jgi:hypothetical protein
MICSSAGIIDPAVEASAWSRSFTPQISRKSHLDRLFRIARLRVNAICLSAPSMRHCVIALFGIADVRNLADAAAAVAAQGIHEFTRRRCSSRDRQ